MTSRWIRRPDGAPPRIEFGGDYNPEQWPRETWDDDVALMQQAGVTVVSLGIFAWAKIQPAPDRFDFTWLDEVVDLLHAGGIGVDLATPTASPPAWLATAHPEILPVDRDGRTLWPGARQHVRTTSPVYLSHALAVVEALASHYAGHPAIVSWHVSNELGCHNALDFSDDAAAAFRVWLQERYGDVDALNHAWGTAFWSQTYGSFAEVLPPRTAPTSSNPTQQLDFARFSSDAQLAQLRAEAAVLRRITPDVPVTTNFMVAASVRDLDYATWTDDVDFVSNDHYTLPHGPQRLDELSFSANLTSGLAGGHPWFLMEHSTSAVNWRPVNEAKREGDLRRDALTHLAHGADAVCFFQWRQSRAGAERFHSAMVPHAGADSAVFRAVTALGAELRTLAPVAGSRRVPARAAILVDQPSLWASELDFTPTSLLRYRQEALDWYSAFLALGVRVDVVPSDVDLSSYSVVVAPVLHVVPTALAARLTAFVSGGGHLVTTYFSGIADENLHVHLGGHPGALRDLLGIRIEEFSPLPEGGTAPLTGSLTGTLWTDRIDLVDPAVAVLARYRGGEYDGRPAITRRPLGPGSAAYVSTRLGPQLTTVLSSLLDSAGVGPELPSGGAVELVVRANTDHEFWFLVNRTDAAVALTGVAGEPLTGDGGEGELTVPARGVTVLRRDPGEGR